jgi:hypothetical protein
MAIQGLPPTAPDTKVSPKAPVPSGPSGDKKFTGIGMSMFAQESANVEQSGTKGDVPAQGTPNPVRT